MTKNRLRWIAYLPEVGAPLRDWMHREEEAQLAIDKALETVAALRRDKAALAKDAEAAVLRHYSCEEVAQARTKAYCAREGK